MPVGRYPANGFGLCDLHGQVWEWMDNEYDAQHRESRKVAKDEGYRHVRGGAWGSTARDTRWSDRDRIVIRVNGTGIRLSRTR